MQTESSGEGLVAGFPERGTEPSGFMNGDENGSLVQ
jgi:hypothetical protein